MTSKDNNQQSGEFVVENPDELSEKSGELFCVILQLYQQSRVHLCIITRDIYMTTVI